MITIAIYVGGILFALLACFFFTIAMVQRNRILVELEPNIKELKRLNDFASTAARRFEKQHYELADYLALDFGLSVALGKRLGWSPEKTAIELLKVSKADKLKAKHRNEELAQQLAYLRETFELVVELARLYEKKSWSTGDLQRRDEILARVTVRHVFDTIDKEREQVNAYQKPQQVPQGQDCCGGACAGVEKIMLPEQIGMLGLL